jgi:hypothetical protein
VRDSLKFASAHGVRTVALDFATSYQGRGLKKHFSGAQRSAIGKRHFSTNRWMTAATDSENEQKDECAMDNFHGNSRWLNCLINLFRNLQKPTDFG